MTRKRDAFQLDGWIFGIVNDEVFAIACARVETDDGFGREESRFLYLFLEIDEDGAVFLFDQADVFVLRCGL